VPDSVVYKAELVILRSILVDDGARKMQGGDAKLLGESSQSAGTPDSELNTPKLAEFERTNAPLVPEVKWQNPERGPYWSHLQQSSRCEQGPVTAKVSVAKLSVQYDEHLLREARNYQFFPSHSTTP
jgi:hypothetical protein